MVAISLELQVSGWVVADLATDHAEVLAAATVGETVALVESGYQIRELER